MSDLISRKEFLKRIEPYNTDDKMDKALYNFAYNKIMDCSSVEPERKTGKWIELEVHNCNATLGCLECGRTIHPTFDFGQYSLNRITEAYPYCHCGVKMEV